MKISYAGPLFCETYIDAALIIFGIYAFKSTHSSADVKHQTTELISLMYAAG